MPLEKSTLELPSGSATQPFACIDESAHALSVISGLGPAFMNSLQVSPLIACPSLLVQA